MYMSTAELLVKFGHVRASRVPPARAHAACARARVVRARAPTRPSGGSPLAAGARRPGRHHGRPGRGLPAAGPGEDAARFRHAALARAPGDRPRGASRRLVLGRRSRRGAASERRPSHPPVPLTIIPCAGERRQPRGAVPGRAQHDRARAPRRTCTPCMYAHVCVHPADPCMCIACTGTCTASAAPRARGCPGAPSRW